MEMLRIKFKTRFVTQIKTRIATKIESKIVSKIAISLIVLQIITVMVLGNLIKLPVLKMGKVKNKVRGKVKIRGNTLEI